MESCSKSDQDETFKEMMKELQNISDWFSLGTHLGVPRDRLRVIEASYPREMSRKKIEMLDAWFNSGDVPSWSELGRALLQVPGHEGLGESILRKYCPDAVDDMQYNSCKSGIPYHIRPSPRIISLKPRDGGETIEQHVPVPPQIVGDIHLHSVPSTLYPPAVSHPAQFSKRSPVMQPPAIHIYSPSPLFPSHLPQSIAIPTPICTLSKQDRIDGQQVTTLRPRDLMAGERIVSHSNFKIDDSQSYTTSISSTSYSISQPKLPQNSVIFGTDGQQVVPTNNPLYFAGFHPIPNPLSPPCRSAPQPSELEVPDLKREVTAERELDQLVFGFQDLLIEIEEIFKREQVSGDEVKTYLERLVCGADVSMEYGTLKSDLNALPRNPTVTDVFKSMSSSLHYDKYDLLRRLVNKFLPHSKAASLMIDKHEADLKNFEAWCPLGFFAKAHGKVFPGKRHLSDRSVALHLNDEWQERPYSDLRSLQRRELCQYVSEDLFHTVHVEKRSIFVIWETFGTAVEQLSVRYWERRFHHLKSQGVLQLFIGRLELDFTCGRKPKVYQIEPMINKRNSTLDPSVMSLHSEQSQVTFDSRKTGQSSGGDSGYTSVGAVSNYGVQKKKPPPVTTHSLPDDTVLDKSPYIEVQFNYSATHDHTMNVQQGQKVKCLSDEDGWSYVVNEQKQYGYIPSRALPKRPLLGLTSSPSLFRHSAISPSFTKESLSEDGLSNCSLAIFDTPHDAAPQTVAVIRREVSLQNAASRYDSLLSPTQSERLRPDTPPSVAHLEAFRVSLSDDRNTVMTEEDSPDILAKQKRRAIKSILKDVESKSLTKSLLHDLKVFQSEESEEIQPTFFRRLQQFIGRVRKESVSTKTHEHRTSANYSDVLADSTVSAEYMVGIENIGLTDHSLNSEPAYV